MRILNWKSAILTCLLLGSISFSSCKSNSSELLGGQKDKHGCLIAAGYTWSKARKDCVRVFEDGIRLHNVNEQNATTSAFAVFSTDKENAEIFLPEASMKHPLLKKTTNGWKDKTYYLTKNKSKLQLYKHGKLIFQE